MKSFLTGSRVYGTPKPDSDIDLCVLLTYREMRKLVMLDRECSSAASEIPESTSLRFGILNLICTYDESRFAEWKIATDDLEKARPVTKDDAIEHFKKIEALRKVSKAALESSQIIGPEATLDEWARLSS